MKNEIFKQFDINYKKIRNYCYKRLNEYKNEFSRTSSENEEKKTEKENEGIKIKQNETPIIFKRKVEQNSSNDIENRIPTNYIKSNYDNYKYNLGIDNDNTEKSIIKNPSRTNCEIPFKKIFKEDIKKIDKKELFNFFYKYLEFNIPIDVIRKRREEKKILHKENLNYNMNNINRVLPGVNKNEYNFHNSMLNLQNNSNNILDFFKINEQEQKYNQLLQNGLLSLLNNQNVNNYLQDTLLNNSLNNYDSITNFNQFNLLNNNINYFGNNINDSYLINNNIINIIQAQNNINNISIINNQDEYSITLKSKTNDPSIEKITKIEIETFFVKDNSESSQQINENSKDEKIKKRINLNDLFNGKEKRTVVRLEPIPHHYSSSGIIKLLDCYLKIERGKNQRIYKALYVPLCKDMGKNLGYCFVMMVKPKYVIDFYNVFNGKIFGKKICKKPCKITWADIQGEELLNPTEEDPFNKPIIFKDIINEEADYLNNYFNFN